jgi:hypothetical protein
MFCGNTTGHVFFMREFDTGPESERPPLQKLTIAKKVSRNFNKLIKTAARVAW